MHRNISCFAHAYFSSAHLCSYGILGYVLVLWKHNQNWKNRWNNDRMSRTRLCTDRINGVRLNRWNNMFMYSLVKSPNDKNPNISAMSDTSATNITEWRSLLWRFWKLQFPKLCQPNFSRLIQRKHSAKKSINRNYLQPYNLFTESLFPTVKGPLWQPGKAAGLSPTHPPSPRWAHKKKQWFSWGEIILVHLVIQKSMR